MSDVRELSDRALLTQTANVVRHDNTTQAALLEHLAEVDRRELYKRESYSSMHAYCVGEHGMSDSVAFKRVQVARLARDFPVVLELLRDKKIHMRGLVLLRPHLTPDNVGELLAAACGKRVREIEALLAARFPREPVESSVRKLPQPRQPSPGASAGETRAEPTQSFLRAPTPARRSETSPISGSEFKVQFTADEEAHTCLQELRDLLRHRIPSGDIAQICKLALSSLRERVLKEKYGIGAKKQSPRSKAVGRSRNIPMAVRREVFERDEGRCQFVGENGKRCGASAFVELDHHPIPWALGGESTVDNLRLLCRSHNQLGGELEFGRSAKRRSRRPGK